VKYLTLTTNVKVAMSFSLPGFKNRVLTRHRHVQNQNLLVAAKVKKAGRDTSPFEEI
jgi:hypothetical protein